MIRITSKRRIRVREIVTRLQGYDPTTILIDHAGGVSARLDPERSVDGSRERHFVGTLEGLLAMDEARLKLVREDEARFATSSMSTP